MTTSVAPTASNALELLASSKTKYILGQARLRRGMNELALLSFHGSLEDALRAHLIRYDSPAADGTWWPMLDALQADERQPLSFDEVERIRRINRIRNQIAHGDHATVAEDTMIAYQAFVATVIARYGVLVVAATPNPHRIAPEDLEAAAPRRPAPQAQRGWWYGYRKHLFPVLLIGSIFLVGALISIGLQQFRAAPTQQPALFPAPTVDPAAPIAAPQAEVDPVAPIAALPAENALAVGRSAVVREDVVAGLALRAEPGVAPEIPALAYLNPGTGVEVIAGPVEADGYVWWQVRVANEQGWCAEAFLELR